LRPDAERHQEPALLEHAFATVAVSELTHLGGPWQDGAMALGLAVVALLAAQREDGGFGSARATG